MDGMMLLWILLIVIALAVWGVWRKGKGPPAKALAVVQSCLRRALDSAGSHELDVLQNEMDQARRRTETRLQAVETQLQTLLASRIPQPSSTQPSTTIQAPQTPDGPVGQLWPPGPRSVSRCGLRFTLSDTIWTHVGSLPSDFLTDDQLSAMIQGPFCPHCLKRWAVPDHVKGKTDFPVHCRYCTYSLDHVDQPIHPISVLDLKREVYESVDQHVRRQRGESSKNV